jgi:hypothetical protein
MVLTLRYRELAQELTSGGADEVPYRRLNGFVEKPSAMRR